MINDAFASSEELFRLLAENCPGVILLEIDRKVAFVSSRIVDIFGYTPEELTQDSSILGRIFSSEAARNMKDELRVRMKENDRCGIQKKLDLISKEGAVITCIVSINSLEYQGKKAYLGIITDLSGLSQADRRLSESQKRYWSLFDASSDAIFLETLDGIVLDCNSAALTSYGYTREEMLGISARDLVAGSSAGALKAIAEELERNEADGKTLHVVSTGKKKDGTLFPAEVTVMPVVIDAEKLYLVTVRDISTRRELEMARKRYDHQLNQLKLLDNFSNIVNGLANDFNNILTGIMGYSDLILRDLSPSSPAREKVRKILEASRKGGEFIQQLISTTGRLPAHFQCADLTQVAREMIPELSEKVNKKGFFTCLLDEGLPETSFDAGQIKVAIDNLVCNAADSVSENGRFQLAIAAGQVGYMGTEPGYFGPPMAAGEYLEIKVSDNGCGIAPERFDSVFEPFYTTKFGRRGLGLSTVLGIVRRHHGAILVKSEPDKGSEFILMLPFVVKRANHNDEAAREATVKAPAGTVLVVDDDETVAEILCAQLESLGFATYQAADGDSGLKMFKQLNHNLDLVILDLAMPGKSGQELLQDLRWLNPEIPVIICTGTHEMPGELQNLAISAIIRKPFRLEQIEEALVKAQLPDRKR